jgi:5-formyltetrahydrofolate cyclo-ligase
MDEDNAEAKEAKKLMRAEALQRRAAAFAKHGPEAGRRLAAFGLDFIKTSQPLIVSGFSAIREEIDPAELLNWLHREGFKLALPVMVGRGNPLIMRAWAPGDDMEEVQWGILEPAAAKAEVEPDVVLVPLLAFDKKGYRIGYGGGFYDRTLAKLRRRKPIVAVGIAYDELSVDAVPHDGYDQRLDWVLTPSGPKKCER